MRCLCLPAGTLHTIHVADAHAACLRWSWPVSPVTQTALHNKGGSEGNFLLSGDESRSALSPPLPPFMWAPGLFLRSASSIKTHLATLMLTDESACTKSFSNTSQHALLIKFTATDTLTRVYYIIAGRRVLMSGCGCWY